MIFWDSSALARCYAPNEKGHERARNLLLSKERHAASIILRPEVVSALVRRFGADRAGRDSVIRMMEDQLREFVVMNLTEPQIDLALDLIRAHSLRGADALHLAAALTAARNLGRRGFRFATSDRDQAAAARARGLRVIEPQ